MEEKMLKKNLFFVIFGMLALCAMLAMACNGGGGDGGDKEEPKPASPTPQELADAAIGSLSTATIGAATGSGEKLVFLLTPDGVIDSSVKFTVSGLTVGTTNITPVPPVLTVTKGSIEVPLANLVDLNTFTATGVDVTVKVKAESGTASSADGNLKIPAASIASVTPAILALRQVNTELAATGGSASLTEESSAGSIGTITVGATYNPAGSISLVYGSGDGSVTVALTGGTTASALASNTFGDAGASKADFVIGSVATILSITDKEYGGSADTTIASGTTASGSVGTFISTGTNAGGSFSGVFLPIEYGSVSASFDGLILNANGLIYNVPNPFVVTVHTTRVGAEYTVNVGQPQ
jgi:hypothetical protein